MVEIRASDLRFTEEEASYFFNQSMQLVLEEEDIHALELRTEGWAVGLQLAALALKNLPDPQNFVETFRGSHRYVLDYLAEEVVRIVERITQWMPGATREQIHDELERAVKLFRSAPDRAAEQAFAACGSRGFVLGPMVGIRADWPWENIEACDRAWRRLRSAG